MNNIFTFITSTADKLTIRPHAYIPTRNNFNNFIPSSSVDDQLNNQSSSTASCRHTIANITSQRTLYNIIIYAHSLLISYLNFIFIYSALFSFI